MIINRSIFAQLWPPFFLTCGVLTVLLVMQQFYELVFLLVEKGLEPGNLALMITYLLPQVFSTTIPLGVVGAVFIVVIRMSVDSEMVTIRAAGKSLWGLLPPFLLFGLLATLPTMVITLWMAPLGFRKHAELQVDLIKSHADKNLVPGRFVTDFGDKVIQIGGRLEGNEVSDIFIANRRHTPAAPVIMADRGLIEVDHLARKVFFRLKNGAVYYLGAGGETLSTVEFASLNYLLEFDPKGRANVRPLVRMSTPDLLAYIDGAKPGSSRHKWGTMELFQRLTRPWSCLVFVLASIPMAIVDPRAGRSGSFMRAIFLVLTYYVIWLGLRDHVRTGSGHAGLLWLPLVLVGLYGIFRIWMVNGDHWWLSSVFRRKIA